MEKVKKDCRCECCDSLRGAAGLLIQRLRETLHHTGGWPRPQISDVTVEPDVTSVCLDLCQTAAPFVMAQCDSPLSCEVIVQSSQGIQRVGTRRVVWFRQILFMFGLFVSGD